MTGKLKVKERRITVADEDCGNEEEEKDESSKKGGKEMNTIQKERKYLKEYLFNEDNKINKNTIKYIFTRCAAMEAYLYEQQTEMEKWKSAYLAARALGKPYAQAAAQRFTEAGTEATSEKEEKKVNQKHEVILVKPHEEKKNGQTRR